VRVNDIQLAPVRGRLRLVAVDVGLAGILRRLGLSGPGERLASALKVPLENYIEWEDVDPVESSVSSLKLQIGYPPAPDPQIPPPPAIFLLCTIISRENVDAAGVKLTSSLVMLPATVAERSISLL
jgi:hypothetical protein